MLLTGDEPKPGGPATDEGLASNWSPWHPRSTTSISGAQEIAKQIEGSYKDGRSKKLSTVEGGPIALNKTLPVSVAIPSAGDRFTVVQGVGVQYKLAGFGKDGRLQGSQPSAERRRLLRREALELSLYSFRYLPDVTMVVTLLPPAPKAEQVHPKTGRREGRDEEAPRRTSSARRCSSGRATCASSSSGRSPRRWPPRRRRSTRWPARRPSGSTG